MADAVGGTSNFASANPIRMLFVVTDTDEGKVAFWFADDGDTLAVTSGKLPRGEKADIAITAKESVLVDLWSGARTRDEAFMAGDLKVEGAYVRWLDDVAPAFNESPWAQAWAAVSKT